MGISSSDPASPAAVFLFGTGTVLSLSTSKIGFGDQMISTTSAQLSVTLTNVGSTQLNFSGIDVIGTNSGDFSQTNNCGTSIAAKASCTIKATFQPSAIGKRTAFIRITDDGGGSPQKVSLTGTGT
jgi:archaellum component FlaF (FlaF/FlaG flagellin family)